MDNKQKEEYSAVAQTMTALIMNGVSNEVYMSIVPKMIKYQSEVSVEEANEILAEAELDIDLYIELKNIWNK